MPKNDNEEYESRGSSSGSRSGGSGGGSSSGGSGSSGGGSKKKNKKSSGGGGGSVLRNVVSSAVGTDALLDMVERLGLVDLVVGRVKSRIEETDLDELLDDIADYLKRNPDVLVVGLAAVTIATGVVVYLNSRREWDGTERRDLEKQERPARASQGKVRKSASAS